MKAVFMVVDFMHPQGTELVAGETTQVDEKTAQEWADCGVARILGVPGSCRYCGCSEYDACVDDVTGEPCHWAEADVCSSCIHKKKRSPGVTAGAPTRRQGDQSDASRNSSVQI